MSTYSISRVSSQNTYSYPHFVALAVVAVEAVFVVEEPCFEILAAAAAVVAVAVAVAVAVGEVKKVAEVG